MDISVKSAAYYDNGDVKSLNIDFGWDSADANSRLVVMTERYGKNFAQREQLTLPHGKRKQ